MAPHNDSPALVNQQSIYIVDMIQLFNNFIHDFAVLLVKMSASFFVNLFKIVDTLSLWRKDPGEWRFVKLASTAKKIQDFMKVICTQELEDIFRR